MAAHPWSSDKLFEAAFEILNSVVQGTIDAKESAKFEAWMQLSSKIANFYRSGTPELAVGGKERFNDIIEEFRDDENWRTETRAEAYEGTSAPKFKMLLNLLFEAGLELAGCVLYKGIPNKAKCTPRQATQATAYVLRKLLPKSTPETQANNSSNDAEPTPDLEANNSSSDAESTLDPQANNGSNKCKLSHISYLETVPRPAEEGPANLPSASKQFVPEPAQSASNQFASELTRSTSNHFISDLARSTPNPTPDSTLPILSSSGTNNEHRKEHSNADSNADSNARKKRKLNGSTSSHELPYHPETAPLVTSEAQPYQNPIQMVEKFLLDTWSTDTLTAIIRASSAYQVTINAGWIPHNCLSAMKMESCTDWIVTAPCAKPLIYTLQDNVHVLRSFIYTYPKIIIDAITQSEGWQTEEQMELEYTRCIVFQSRQEDYQVALRVGQKYGEAFSGLGVLPFPQFV